MKYVKSISELIVKHNNLYYENKKIKEVIKEKNIYIKILKDEIKMLHRADRFPL